MESNRLTNLVSWLRISAAGSLDPHVGQAADAIEAQAKRIEELEKNYEEAREELTASYLCGYERAKSELSDRIAELEAALKPFADMAKDAEWFLSNNEPMRLTASSIAAAIRERSNEQH